MKSENIKKMISDVYWGFLRILYHILWPSLVFTDDSIPIPDEYRGQECLYKGVKAVYLGAKYIYKMLKDKVRFWETAILSTIVLLVLTYLFYIL